MSIINLGLGINLSLEDNFTRQADMTGRAMGRLQQDAQDLRTTMNREMSVMTKEFQSNMINLQNFMIAGFSFNQVGGQVENAGRGIVNSYKKLVSGIVDTGKYFETAQASMKSFFKSAEEIDAVMHKTIKTASETPFEINDLVDAVRSMKAVGSDAYKEYAGVNGEMKELIRYIGDLGAFKPSQGVDGALFAYREALGGNIRSLKMRFEVNPELVLGRKLSTNSVEEFNQDFAEFMSKLAPNMMENLYGTFPQILANLRDNITKLKWAMADGGLFDASKNSLAKLGSAVERFYETANLDKLGEALHALWKPIDLLVNGIVKTIDAVARLSNTHPWLAKLVITVSALSGGFLFLSGAIMRVTGSTIVLIASVTSLVMQWKLASSLMSIDATWSFSRMILAVTKGMKAFSLFGLVATGVYLGYKNNVRGMRTETDGFFKSFTRGWQESNKILDLSSDYADTVFSKWGQRIARFRAMGGLFTAIMFGEREGSNIHISRENWNLAESLGLEDFVGFLARARYRLFQFTESFKKGFGIIGVAVKNFLQVFLVPFKAVLKAIGVDVDGLFSVFKSPDSQDLEGWHKQIEAFKSAGEAIGTLVGLMLSFKSIKIVGSIVSAPFKMISSTARQASTSVSNLGTKMAGVGIAVGSKYQAGKSKFSQLNEYALSRSSLPRIAGGRAYDFHPAYSQLINPNTAGQRVGNRSSLMRTLFGVNTYNSNGTKTGRFGGIFNINRDSRNLQYGHSNYFAKRQFSRHSVNDFRLPNGSYDTASYAKARRWELKGFHGSQQIGKLKDFTSNIKSQLDPNVSMADLKRTFASDPRMISKYGRAGKLDLRTLNGLTKEQLNARLMESGAVKSKYLRNNANSAVFRESRGAWRSKIFGNRMYTLNQNKFGEFDPSYIGRSGGLIPKLLGKSNKYNPFNSLGNHMSGFRSLVSDTTQRAQLAGRYFMGNTKLGGFTSKLGTPLGFLGRGAKNGLGLMSRGAVGGAKGAWGLAKGGFKVGKGALGLGGKALGFVGRNIMPAMMIGALGKTVWDSLAQGTDDDGNELKGADAVTHNLAKIKENMGSFDFGEFWGNFKEKGAQVGKEVWGILGAGLKIAKENYKQIFGEFWEWSKTTGVTLLGQAWEWIATDGVAHLGNLGNWFITDGIALFFKAFTSLLDWILTSFVPWSIKALLGFFQWASTDGLGLLWDGLKALMKWFGTDLLPTIVSVFSNIFTSILGAIGSAIGGMWNAIMQKMPSPIRKIFGIDPIDSVVDTTTHQANYIANLGADVPKPTSPSGFDYSNPTHHGGLWLSPDEHSAIIRRDETVLPPDVSRKLNKMLDGDGGQGGSIRIDKMEFTFEVKQVSQSEARRFAQMVKKELELMQKEKAVRQHLVSPHATL